MVRRSSTASSSISRVARYTENFVVDKPLDDVRDACLRAFQFGRWQLLDASGQGFYVKERLDLVGMLMSYATRWAVFLRPLDEKRTQVELLGATMGFGPLPKGRLRQRYARLKSEIEAQIHAAIPVADPAADPAKPG